MGGWDDDWQRGDRLGDYRLVAKVGEGGICRVYEAVHPALGTRVAIKTLRPDRRGNANTRARFEREGLATARVHHPHVVKVITVGTHREAPYLVMEFLTGKDLEHHLQTRGPMAMFEALGLLLPVMSALQAAHDEGLVHRDLKPANIEESGDGRTRPVVVDFGIARVVDVQIDQLNTRGSAVLGTPAYMAPEQTRGAREVSAQCDQYALGVILYECLTGSHAFEGATMLELLTNVSNGSYVPLRVTRPDVPDELAQVIARAMTLDPMQRYASVRELALALLPFADDLSRALWTPTFSVVRARRSRPAVERFVDSTPSLDESNAGAPSGHRSTLGDAARSIDTEELPPAPKAPRRAMWAAGLLALMIMSVTLGVVAQHRYAVPRGFTAELAVEPRTAQISVDGRAVARGEWRGEYARDDRPHRVVVEADGYEREELTFVNAPPPRALRLRARPTQMAQTTPVVQVIRTAPAPSVAAPATTPPEAPRERATATHSARSGRPRVGRNAGPSLLGQPAAAGATGRLRPECVGPNGTNLCL
jgi:eukaryotic-like serine/threonine-protein kinase